MAKKRAANQPIVAEEPARPEEQFSLDQPESAVAPPSTRTRASGAPKSFAARTARERRAGRAPSGNTSRRERHHDGISAQVVSDLLHNPTRTVTEAALREEYSYVISDLRSMAILSAGLIVALIVLAQVLPK